MVHICRTDTTVKDCLWLLHLLIWMISGLSGIKSLSAGRIQQYSKWRSEKTWNGSFGNHLDEFRRFLGIQTGYWRKQPNFSQSEQRPAVETHPHLPAASRILIPQEDKRLLIYSSVIKQQLCNRRQCNDLQPWAEHVLITGHFNFELKRLNNYQGEQIMQMPTQSSLNVPHTSRTFYQIHFNNSKMENL